MISPDEIWRTLEKPFEARWISPFGPLRAAYGFNLDPNPLERKGVFEFSEVFDEIVSQNRLR